MTLLYNWTYRLSRLVVLIVVQNLGSRGSNEEQGQRNDGRSEGYGSGLG